MVEFVTIELDLNLLEAETERQPESSCDCAGACDCDHSEDSHYDGDGHDHGDGNHFHDMIDRYSVQLGTREDGDIIAAGTEAGKVIETTSEVSTPPIEENELAQGNLGFTLNDTGGAGVGTQARAAFESAVELWQFLLADNVNIALDVGFQALNPGILGSTGSTTTIVSFSAFKTALTNDATSADDATATANLPGGSSQTFLTQNENGTLIFDNNGSANNNFLAIKTANAKALGITTDANGQPINPSSDASITFSNLFTWDFDPSDGITSGSQDFVGVAFHEIGHALGFTSGVDLVDYYHGAGPGNANLDNFAVFNSLDVFRYSATGQKNVGYDGNPYFSIDGGVTNLGAFSTGRRQGDGQQASHWKDGLGLGIMDPTANPAGNVNNPTNLDLMAFDVIGWDKLVDNVNFGTQFNNTLNGSSTRDLLMGRDGNDTLNGLADDDRLVGGDGNDTLNGGAGEDIIEGGNGTDTASYAGSASAVTVSLANNALNAGSDAQGDMLSSIENLIGSLQGDTLNGNGAVNVISGGGGDDFINASSGNDTLNGESGDDTLIGGAGGDVIDGGTNTVVGDTASYSNSNAAVNVDLGADTASGGHATGDDLNDIENLFGSVHADTLVGDGSANTINGFSGNDTLDGGGGADTLQGGSGDDTILSGAGADVNNGGIGLDTVNFSGSAAGVNVRLNGSVSTGGNAQGDVHIGIENIVGSAFADVLIGNTLRNILSGGDGDDTISGSNNVDTLNGDAGDDLIIGGRGADILDGGTNTAVGDTVSYSNSGQQVTVDLDTGGGTGSATGSGHGSGDVLTNFENIFGSRFNDSLTGDSGNNEINGFLGNDDIFGEGGNDNLIGGSGNDNLNGGTGNDTMLGGAGLDTFIYTTLAFGQDTITGWQNNQDMLDFTALGLDENGFTITQDGADTLITLNSDNAQTIRLAGINANSINGDDFVDLPPPAPIMVPDTLETVSVGDEGGYLASDPVEALVLNELANGGGFLAGGMVVAAPNLPQDGGYQGGTPIQTLGSDDQGGYQASDDLIDTVADTVPDDPGGHGAAQTGAEAIDFSYLDGGYMASETNENDFGYLM
ncbi:MAG: NF038122 family metalloprotease [Rhizobiaceae bacterium]